MYIKVSFPRRLVIISVAGVICAVGIIFRGCTGCLYISIKAEQDVSTETVGVLFTNHLYTTIHSCGDA